MEQVMTSGWNVDVGSTYFQSVLQTSFASDWTVTFCRYLGRT
jgi:hypothetical protein